MAARVNSKAGFVSKNAQVSCSKCASHPQKFDELLQLASKGQHTNVDMLVKDVYGGAYQTLGLSGNLIASSFGKSTTADKGTEIKNYLPKRLLWLLGVSFILIYPAELKIISSFFHDLVFCLHNID